MARIRTIKPEFWSSEQIMLCSPTARLLFIGLWNFCDDNGIHPASLVRLKAEVFPSDLFTNDQMMLWISELMIQNLIQEYRIIDPSNNGSNNGSNDRSYWIITGWQSHQKIEKPTYKYPLPQFDDHSTTIRRVIDNHSTTEWKGMEGNGREEEGKKRLIKSDQMIRFDRSNFDQFWSAYPRKVGKAKSLATWKSKKLERFLSEILEDLKQRTDWNNHNPFTPHPTTYLNGKRWEDEQKISPQVAIAETKTREERVMDIVQKMKQENENESN